MVCDGLKLVLAVVAFVGVVGAPAGEAGATVLVKKTLARLTAEAEVVVIGEVTATRSEWYRDTRLIYTHSTIAVASVLKGKASRTIVVSEPGGTVGGLTGVVAGAPAYRVGERVLVFCKKDALGLLRTHGMIQGRFSIVTNRATGEDVVPVRAGLPWVLAGAFPEDARTVPIEDLVDVVAEFVENARAREPATGERSQRR